MNTEVALAMCHLACEDVDEEVSSKAEDTE